MWRRLGLLLMGLLLPALLMAGPVAAEVCAPINDTQADALFNRWNSAIQSGDPEQVVALYSPDALLLPTLSAEIGRAHV